MAAGRLVGGTSPDQTAKIKREQSLRNMRRGPSVGVATKPAADIAHDLKADIRIGIIAEIDAAEIQGVRTNQVRTPVLWTVSDLRIRAGLVVLASLGIG